MKRTVAVFIIALALLTGCDPLANANPEQNPATGAATQKKPRIPAKPAAKPAAEQPGDLLNALDSSLNQPAMTEEDVRRGWYYGTRDEKKFGTPSHWKWVEDGNKSRWVSSDDLIAPDYEEEQALCQSTGGIYKISCVESESPDCDYIPENQCDCPLETRWEQTQGCIMTRGDDFVTVTPDEIEQGWYAGRIDQKKQNTPAGWVWKSLGQTGQWQNAPHR